MDKFITCRNFLLNQSRSLLFGDTVVYMNSFIIKFP